MTETAPPPEPARRGPWLALGALAAAAGMAVAIVVLFSPEDGVPPPPEPPPEAPRPASRRPAAAVPPSAAPKNDAAAQAAFARAEAVERARPGDYEAAMAAWREVAAGHPGTPWARKAEDRRRAAGEALATYLEREFESARKGAAALAAAGHFADAVEAIRAYRKEQAREALRARADAEIASLENQSRAAYNEAVRDAQERAKAGRFEEAFSLLGLPAEGGIPEVAARSAAGLAELRALAAQAASAEEARRIEEARRTLRDRVAGRVLPAVRARRYEEALRELGPASAHPAVAEEREAILAASRFWEAFLKAARDRAGRPAALLLADGRRVSGKLAAVGADRISLDGPAGPVEAPLGKVRADQVAAWTIGTALSAVEAATQLQAALFYFCEGDDEAARIHLATARERGGDIGAAERVFRSGLLREASFKPPGKE